LAKLLPEIFNVIRFLKIHDPENVTPEKTISLLEDLQACVHSLSHTNPELLEKLHQELNL
jgi:hypothetical protein